MLPSKCTSSKAALWTTSPRYDSRMRAAFELVQFLNPISRDASSISRDAFPTKNHFARKCAQNDFSLKTAHDCWRGLTAQRGLTFPTGPIFNFLMFFHMPIYLIIYSSIVLYFFNHFHISSCIFPIYPVLRSHNRMIFLTLWFMLV